MSYQDTLKKWETAKDTPLYSLIYAQGIPEVSGGIHEVSGILLQSKQSKINHYYVFYPTYCFHR